MILAILFLEMSLIDPGVGTAGYNFLHILPTAREAALAGSAVARPKGAMGFYYNPAVLFQTPEQVAELSYINYVAGMHLGSLGYAQALGLNKGVGLGIFYFNSGKMKRTNEQGDEMGDGLETFSASYAQFNISGGVRFFDRLALGMGLCGLYGAIDTFFSFGIAGNFGLVYEIKDYGLNLGFRAANLGREWKTFNGVRDRMPTEFGVGVSWEPISALNMNLSLHKPVDNRLNVGLGVEGWVNDYLVIRLGYNSLGQDLTSGSGSDIIAGFTTGLGVRYDRYQVDYCFVPMVVLGFSHRISFSFSL